VRSKYIRDERELNPLGQVMTDPEFLKKLALVKEVEITVTGRKSRRSISTPVWFVHEGQKLYLVPVNGTDSNWYKNVLAEPAMQISADERKVRVKATPVSDSHKVAEVVERLRLKYGAGEVKKYYSKLDAALEAAI
jgi:deazaflavin-dependent oxidoreductase (nitroreductase family)